MSSSSCWAYTAVSSDRQAETLDDQVGWIEQTAAEHRWTITRRFQGVSTGVAGTRKLLEDLLSELKILSKAQRPGRILMTRLDRTGRGLGLEPMAAFAEIHRLGVIIHTREDGDNSIKRASDTIKPFLRILTGALENEARSDKWKAVHARRRKAGLHVGSVPFGCILVDGRAVPYEPEARIVREIFERAADGWGYTRLARWAQAQCDVKRQLDGTEKRRAWAPSTIKSLFESQTLRGLVVPEDLWERARAARAQDFRVRAARRWPWPLNGAIRCTCGKLLSGRCAGDEPYRTRYYICRWHELPMPEGDRVAARTSKRPNARRVGRTTKYPSHRADELEAQFVELLERIVADPSIVLHGDAGNQSEALEREERAMRARLDDLDRRRQRIWKIAEEGDLTGAQVRERLDEIDADRARASADLARVRDAIDTARRAAHASSSVGEVLADLARLWPEAPADRQQEIARAIAAIPEIGGVWAAPESRGVLIIGADAAMLPTADAFRSFVTGGMLVTLARLRAAASI